MPYAEANAFLDWKSNFNGPQTSSKAVNLLHCDDILKVSNVTEQLILQVLKIRYKNQVIYTNVGPILIALNPYTSLPALYTRARMTQYSTDTAHRLPPHVFAIAQQSYTQLLRDPNGPCNQSILITGESGAGKTETMKYLMQYLTQCTSPFQQEQPPTLLEACVLKAQPVLEAFGNAKTSRNDNSSRFGKYIEIQFNARGKMTGAEIHSFLLERTRIVALNDDERNYHIFYQLLAGADEDMRNRLKLGSPREFVLLRSDCSWIPGCDDAKRFANTIDCMSALSISALNRSAVFTILGAILHLGNVSFRSAEDSTYLRDEMAHQTLHHAAKLLGINAMALEKALLTRSMFVDGKTIVQKQQSSQVCDKRDAIAKALYANTFQWLLSKVNESVSTTDRWGSIGILDMYGFENFQVNTFEQLCINYANEKLQWHFMQQMISYEQQEYVQEGIPWQFIAWKDNAACLELIEAKVAGSAGILITLDDCWRHKDLADKRFLGQLHASFGRKSLSGSSQHAHYLHPKVHADKQFGIRHFAGDVLYDVKGFNEKNSETLTAELRDILKTSENPFVAGLFQTRARARDRSLRETSVGMQFRAQLHRFMQSISDTQSAYVRCIKPNTTRETMKFENLYCQQQLCSSGMLQVVQIRQQGFPVRVQTKAIFQAFGKLFPTASNGTQILRIVSGILGLHTHAWACGSSKLFLRLDIAVWMHQLFKIHCRTAAKKIQKGLRKYRLRVVVVKLQRFTRRCISRKRSYRAAILIKTFVLSHRARRPEKSAMKQSTPHLEPIRQNEGKESFSDVPAECNSTIAQLCLPTPVTISSNSSISEACELMTRMRCEAVLVLDSSSKRFCGMITDEDVADRLIAHEWEATTPLAKIVEMCPVVHTHQDVVEVFDLMQKEGVHHVPVLQNNQVHGVVTVSHYLHDTLERMKTWTQALQEESDGMDLTLYSFLENIATPSLDDLIQSGVWAQKRPLLVERNENVASVTSKMRKYRQIALVMDADSQLCGIFTTKDLIHRVLAKRRNPQLISVMEVMTPHPERVSPLQNAFDALRMMHEERFLHLPMIQNDQIIGIVDVLAIIGAILHQERIERLWKHLCWQTKVKDSWTVASLDSSPAIPIDSAATAGQAIAIMKQTQKTALLVTQKCSLKPTSLVGVLCAFEIYREILGKKQSLDTPITHLCLDRFEWALPEDDVFSLVEKMRCNKVHFAAIKDPQTNKCIGIIDTNALVSGVYSRLGQLSVSKDVRTRAIDSGAMCASHFFEPIWREIAEPLIELKSPGRLICISEATTLAQAVAKMNKRDVLLVNGANERLSRLVSPDLITQSIHQSSEWPADEMLVSTIHHQNGITEPNTSLLEALGALHDTQCEFLGVKVDEAVDVIHGMELCHQAFKSIQTRNSLAFHEMKSFLATTTSKSASFASTMDTSMTSSRDSDTHLSPTVAELRPAKAICIDVGAKLLQLVSLFHQSQSPCVIVCEKEDLCGVVTETDVANRMVGERRDLQIALVSEIMTKKPIWVSSQSSATDALNLMLEHRVHHLPVKDSITKQITGVLHFQSCVLEAIQLLESAKSSFVHLPSELEMSVSPKSARRTMDQTFGSSVGYVLSQHKNEVVALVGPQVCVADVCKRMATSGAALIIDPNGTCLGICTPKLLLQYVRTLGHSLKTTAIADVMEPIHSASLQPDATVLDAMKLMRDRNVSALPVVQSTEIARPLGVVTFESLSGGIDCDWRAFWNASFDIADRQKRRIRQIPASNLDTRRQSDRITPSDQTVANLRPSKSVTVTETLTVTELAAILSQRRSDSALVISEDGVLQGIVTDTDIAYRVVGVGNDPNRTIVSEIMTPKPEFVFAKDRALDAMFAMLQGRFRHLPVINDRGVVDGILRIQKCLDDAIQRLEGMQKASGEMAHSVTKQPKSDTARPRAVETLLDKLFSPSLAALLERQKHEVLIVSKHDTISVAVGQMMRVKGAALVVDRSQVEEPKIVGLLTPNDLLLRVIANKLDANTSKVSQVMSMDPTIVSSSMLLLDAFRLMYRENLSYLPVVRESDDSKKVIVGVLDVFSLCYGTFTAVQGSSLHDGDDWRSFWDISLTAIDEQKPCQEIDPKRHRTERKQCTQSSFPESLWRDKVEIASMTTITSLQDEFRPVSMLHPRKVMCLHVTSTVAEAAKLMRQARAEAIAVTSRDGEIQGILTDTDIARRVIARDLDPNKCLIESVMTSRPCCVHVNDSAIEAITRMLEGQFKHLPVIGQDGKISGMLDISKCLVDAVECMEKVHQANLKHDSSSTTSLISRVFSSSHSKIKYPTVLEALENESKPPIIPCTMSVLKASKLMVEHKKAAIIVDSEDRIVGMLTPKDILRKLVAKGLKAKSTSVHMVMTKDPDFILPSATILDSLRRMYDAGQLFMPVLGSGTKDVIGMVDVLSLSCSQFSSTKSKDSEDWRRFWLTAINMQRDSGYHSDDDMSMGTIDEFLNEANDQASATPRRRKACSSLRSDSCTSQLSSRSRETFVFKISDQLHNHYHRIRSRFDQLELLEKQIRGKIRLNDNTQLRMRYEDDDGDLIILNSDESLMEAVDMAKRASWRRLMILVDTLDNESVEEDKKPERKSLIKSLRFRREGKAKRKQQGVVAGGAAAVMGIATVALFMFNRK
uniref:Myosinlike protein putative n=1 Tax=Albugo laibachii Nc14 TaxID=890382 RepID=F0W6Q5_9STRA|nr:myosinlike protein putative [Albugo laibachii Nc14]|eukprot:CCA16800.1 myosinlike protein putative [Albugo laibachii Nc14]